MQAAPDPSANLGSLASNTTSLAVLLLFFIFQSSPLGFLKITTISPKTRLGYLTPHSEAVHPRFYPTWHRRSLELTAPQTMYSQV